MYLPTGCLARQQSLAALINNQRKGEGDDALAQPCLQRLPARVSSSLCGILQMLEKECRYVAPALTCRAALAIHGEPPHGRRAMALQALLQLQALLVPVLPDQTLCQARQHEWAGPLPSP